MTPPDAKTIWDFKQRIKQGECPEEFDENPAVLAEFASRGINLTRLESRPTRSKLGIYYFLVDADGHLADPAMADVVAALIRRQALLRWLGSYPRAAGVNDPTADFATPVAYEQAAAQVGRWQRGG